MYYLTKRLGTLTVDDSIAILAGATFKRDDTWLEGFTNFSDDGRVAAGLQTGDALTLKGANKTLHLIGNRGTGDYFVSLSLRPGAETPTGNYAAVRYAGAGAGLNFAADAGAAHPAGIFDEANIGINASMAYQTSTASAPTPSMVTMVISAINALSDLTIFSDLGGVVTSDNTATHNGYVNGSGENVELCVGGAPVAYGIIVGTDLALKAGLSGTVSATVSSTNRSIRDFSVSNNSATAVSLQVRNGKFSVEGSITGAITAEAVLYSSANSLNFKPKTSDASDELPSSGAATATGQRVAVTAIEAVSVSVGSIWGGAVAATVKDSAVYASIKKTGYTDAVVKDPLNPPNADVSANASSGTINVYGVKSGAVSVGSITGSISAVNGSKTVEFAVSALATGKNATATLSDWAVDINAFSVSSMDVNGNFGGTVNAYSNMKFNASALANRSYKTPVDDKPAELADPKETVSSGTRFENNKMDVIGVDVANKLKIAGALSATFTVQGVYSASVSSTGGNAVGYCYITGNDMTVIGIRAKSIEIGGSISGNITVIGSMGITMDASAGDGKRITVWDEPVNVFAVYGIKTDSLSCSEISGTISVTSVYTGNYAWAARTVGIFAEGAINGGSEDIALSITGSINVTADVGIAAGIMRGSASKIGSINIRVSGNLSATSIFGGAGNAYAIYLGDAHGTGKGKVGGGVDTEDITAPIDDRVELAAGAYVKGSFELSTGTNFVTIDSRAQMVGNIMTTGGTLNLQFNLVGASTANHILSTSTDFGSAECSISTFTLNLNEAESGIYKLMSDSNGVNGKWVGREVSLLYQGQTYVIKVGLNAGNAQIRYLDGADGTGIKVYLNGTNSIVADIVDASPNISVAPDIANPSVVLNSVNLHWQDMSISCVPADPVDPDAPFAGVAWDGKQLVRYEVEFSVSTNFDNSMSRYILSDNSGYAPNSLYVDGLGANTYFWRVRAVYADGTLSGWSDSTGESGTFTVVDRLLYTTPEAISTSTMSAVDPNGEAGKYVNSTVLLDWSESSAATGIGYYVVEYFTSSDKADFYLNLKGEWPEGARTTDSIIEEWNAANPDDVGTKSNDEIISEWQAANPDGIIAWTADQMWDKVLARTDISIQTRMVSASELLLTGLGNYTNLHWRVKAVANDLGGNLDNVPTEGEWSYYQDSIVVWSADKTAPTAASKLDVNAIVNADDPTKIDMELLWNVSNDAQSGVQRYVVQYGLSQDWSNPANYTEVTVSGSAAQLSPNGKVTIPGLGETLNNQCYYWRVQAIDYVGNTSAWTEGKTFIIDMTAPTDPVLVGVTTSGTTALGADGITFTWTPSVDASTLTYDIQISVSGDFSSDVYSVVTGTSGTADTSGNLYLTVSDEDFADLLTGSGYTFADGATFHWRVKAFDHPVGASYSNESNWVSGQFVVDLTDDTPPVGPTTVTAAQIPGQRSISVTWTPATDNKTAQADLRYVVAYKAVGDADWTTRPVSTNSFTLTGVNEGIEYFFKVQAYDTASKYGEWSAETSITCDATAPTNNAGLASTVTPGPNGSIVFSWNVATDAGDAAQSFNTNYELQYSTSYLFTPGAGLHSITVDASNMVIANGRVTLTVSGADLAKFADLTTYFWRIQAVDHAGNKSAFSSGTDKFVAPDVTAPAQPANLTMVRVPNQTLTRFQWDASSDNSRNVTYILSYWSKPDKSDIQSVDGITGNSKELALKQEGHIYWSVQAIDNAQNKSVATEAEGTIDYVAPFIPGERVSSVNQNTRAVTLSWTPANPDDAVPGSGLAKYEIRYSNTSAYNPDDTVTVTVDRALSQFVLGSNLLKDGETYYWQIRAIDRNGNASVWNDGAGAFFVAPDTTNRTDDAKPITLGQAVNERIGGPKDSADYYFLTLANTGNYTFTVTSSATTVGISLVNLANNQTISYRSGQTVDLKAGNYRIGVTNSGASVEYTFNSVANSIYSINNNDDTWNNVANNSQIVMTANDSVRSGEATDWVGFGDDTDYYKLVLDKAGTYTLAIDGLDNNAVMTLNIVNAAGTGINTQSGWSTTAQVYRSSSGVTITNNKLLDKMLAAGTYYVKVDRTGLTNTNYHISVTGTALPTDNTDDSAALVDSLVSTDPGNKHKLEVSADGVISGYSDWAGFGDTTDFYTFTLTGKGTYMFELGNLSNRASLTLVQKTATGTTPKANFSVTPSATVSGAKTALLNLDEGTYYIQVTATDGNAGKNTDYTVSVTGSGALAGEDDNNANTAFVLNNPLSDTAGELSGSFSDWVGFGDISDFRMVGMAQGAVSLTVSVDIENPATVYVYRVAELSAGPGTLIGTITPTLTFNTDGSIASLRNNILTVNTGSATDGTYKYYVEVRSTGAVSGKNTDYTLISGGGTNNVNAADNNQAGAQLIALDADGAAAVIHDGGIGFGDTQDYFKLVLAQDGVYGFSIDGLTGSTSTVTLRLLNSSGSQLKTVTVNLAAGYSSGYIDSQLLKAGTYYINVNSPNAGFTGYNLTVDGAYSLAGGNSRATALDLDFSVVPPTGGVAGRMAAPVDASAVVTMGGNASGWVGAGDTVDFYRFTVDSDGNYNFAFRGVDNAAVLTIYAKSFNSLGQEIASTALGQVKSRGNIADLSLLLTSGDYYVEVSSASATSPVNTNYYIDATATTFATLQVNSLNAIDFEAAGSTTYRFDLAMDGDIALSIDGDAAQVRYALYHKVGNELVEIKSSNRSGDLNIKDLDAGAYFVKVNYAGAGTANFELALDLPDQVPPAAGSLSLDAAVDDGASAGLQLAGVDSSELTFGLNPCDSLLAAGSELGLEAEKQDALKLGLLA